VGRNPYGRLYAASRLGEPCILALLNTGDDTLNEKYLTAARLMAGLHHPNLIRVLDTGLYPEGFFVAWESPSGTDLRTWNAEKRFMPFERKLTVAARLCEALDMAHAAGFVHRNIEPRHIFVEDSGSVKLGEFIFMESGRLQLSPYSSPEQLHGSTTIDGRSDQFSLGCVLYEWLAGIQPFHGAHGHSVLASILSEPHRPLWKRFPLCAPELDQIFDRALAKRPGDRYSSCGEFGGALKEFVPRIPSLAADLQKRMAARRLALEASGRTLAALLPNHDLEHRSSLPSAASQDSDYGLLLEWHAEADRYLTASRDALRAGLPLLGQLKSAYDLFMQGDLAGCERELRDLLSGAPNHGPAQRLLDLCLQRRSSQSRRMEYQSRRTDLIAQMRSALEREQTALALVAANVLLEFEPAQAEAIALQQEATRRLNQADVARKQKIKELLETCRARLRTGQYDAALKASEELLKLAPESGFALSALELEMRKDAAGEGES
jgi:serine/threonine-protein kinase